MGTPRDNSCSVDADRSRLRPPTVWIWGAGAPPKQIDDDFPPESPYGLLGRRPAKREGLEGRRRARRRRVPAPKVQETEAALS